MASSITTNHSTDAEGTIGRDVVSRRKFRKLCTGRGSVGNRRSCGEMSGEADYGDSEGKENSDNHRGTAVDFEECAVEVVVTTIRQRSIYTVHTDRSAEQLPHTMAL